MLMARSSAWLFPRGFHDQGNMPEQISCPMYMRMEFIPGKYRGVPDQNLYTSINRYMIVRRINAMLPVAIMKLTDHKFLLMGITPWF